MSRTERPLLEQAALPILAFLVVTVSGVAGFVLLEGISVVEATFWLLDPTSIELHDAGEEVKAFALVVFVGLFVTALWIGETVIEAAFGGQITEEIKRVRRKRQVDDLTGHAIVCGYGIFGRTIANTLANADHDVVAIEQDEHRIDTIENDSIVPLQGDAGMESTLLEAGIERADVLVAAIDDSNTNIEIAILASQLAPDVRVIVRVGNDRYSKLARRAGADDVIIPEITSGQYVTQSILDIHTRD